MNVDGLDVVVGDGITVDSHPLVDVSDDDHVTGVRLVEKVVDDLGVPVASLLGEA